MLRHHMSRDPAAVDLFCGAGGLSYGMKRAGIDMVAGIDADPTCKTHLSSNVGTAQIIFPDETVHPALKTASNAYKHGR